MLVESIIAQFCLSLSGVDYAACSKALEATSLQCHVSQDVSVVEGQVAAFAYKKATEATSQKFLGVVGYAIKVVREKSISYPIVRQQSGVVPSINTTAGIDGGSVVFRWEL